MSCKPLDSSLSHLALAWSAPSGCCPTRSLSMPGLILGAMGEFPASRLKKTTLVNCTSHPPTVNLFCLMLGTGGRDMQSAQTRWCICSQYFLASNSTITTSRNLHAHSQGNFDICIAVWVFALHLVDLTHMIPIKSLHITVHVCFH
jgi:hypothetical protein